MCFCQLGKFREKKHYTNNKFQYIKMKYWEEKQRYKNNKSQYNKMNEQYEMVTWLISWFVAPYAFPCLLYGQFIFIIFWRSYVYTCKGTMLMPS